MRLSVNLRSRMAAGNFDIQGKALIILNTCLVEYQYNCNVKKSEIQLNLVLIVVGLHIYTCIEVTDLLTSPTKKTI